MPAIFDPSKPLSFPSPESMLFAETPDAFMEWIDSDAGNADALGDDGMTPLCVLAIEQRHALGLALLLQRGAALQNHVALLKARDIEGLALLLLVQTGHLDMFTALLHNGVDANLSLKMGPVPVPNFILKRMDQKMMETPILHLVAECPDIGFIEALLGAGAQINAVDSEGNTALHVAAVKPHLTPEGTFPVVDALIRAGADKTIKNRQGYNPLEYLDVFFNAVSPDILMHPTIQKLKTAISPSGEKSSIILLS